MNARILTSGERKELLVKLNELFGIAEIPDLILETGKDKLRAFSGDLPKEELLELASITRVEIVGLYFARREFGTRLSFDATQMFLGIQHVIELDEEDAQKWMQGQNLSLVGEAGTYIIRSGTDFLGCGYCDGTTLQNFVPKERRLKR